MYRLTNSVPYLLNRVGVRMGEMFSQRLAPYDVTLPMYRVLAGLSERADQRLGDLSEMTSVELSTLSRLVGTMKRQGFVSRARPDANGRTVEINLTPKGRALATKLMPLAAEFEWVGTQGLTSGEISILKDRLVAIYRNLDELERSLSGERGDEPARKREAPGSRAR
jgi:MarR family transcriptional regulator, organic hydroperoxide resistance regulator